MKKVLRAELQNPYKDERGQEVWGLMVIKLGADHTVYRTRPQGWKKTDLPKVGTLIDPSKA